MCLEVDLMRHRCAGRNQGQLLAFERPEQLGRWGIAVMKKGGVLLQARWLGQGQQPESGPFFCFQRCTPSPAPGCPGSEDELSQERQCLPWPSPFGFQAFGLEAQ